MNAKIRMIDPGMRIGQTIVYAWSCPYDDHKGYLKIGQTERNLPKRGDDSSDNSECLINAAKKRILEDTKTGAFKHTIEFATLFNYEIISEDGSVPDIDDMVRAVLKRSGFREADFDVEAGDEWVECDVNAVKQR